MRTPPRTAHEFALPRPRRRPPAGRAYPSGRVHQHRMRGQVGVEAMQALLLVCVGLTLTHGLAIDSGRNCTVRSDRGADAQPDSVALWMRYTEPRTISKPAQHSDEEVVTKTFEQNLDQIQPQSSTWPQTYLRCGASYAAGGPAFVMLAGTDGYASDWLREGHMADLARRLRADRFFLTTRFYGDAARPTLSAEVDSLQYLTTEQVLLDVRAFLLHLRAAGELAEGQKVILFGAGYGGAVAVWARQRFPELIDGVVASSATVEARYEVSTYFPVVNKAIDWYHSKKMACTDALSEVFTKTDALLSSSEGRRRFNSLFQPCSPFAEAETVSALDRAQTLGLLASMVADEVQEDEDGADADGLPGGDKTFPLCYLLTQAISEPLQSFALLVKTSLAGRCLETSFAGLVRKLNVTDWEAEANAHAVRPWLWQQCTELGQFATTSSTLYDFPYVQRLDMAFYMALCENVFGTGVTSDLLNNIRSINRKYGGRKPSATNVIYVKGDLDPWNGLTPVDSLQGGEVYVFSVLRASHAHDMFPRDNYDPPWMKSVRKRIAVIVAGWLTT